MNQQLSDTLYNIVERMSLTFSEHSGFDDLPYDEQVMECYKRYKERHPEHLEALKEHYSIDKHKDFYFTNHTWDVR